jgi:hypothetical protein
MSSEEARDDFERIEDEAERAMVRLIIALAAIITTSWGVALAVIGGELINKL